MAPAISIEHSQSAPGLVEAVKRSTVLVNRSIHARSADPIAGTIAGVVIGCVVGALLLGWLLHFAFKKFTQRRNKNKFDSLESGKNTPYHSSSSASMASPRASDVNEKVRVPGAAVTR